MDGNVEACKPGTRELIAPTVVRMTDEVRTTSRLSEDGAGDATGRLPGEVRPVREGEPWRAELHPQSSRPEGAVPRPVESLDRHEVRAVVASDGTRYCVFCLRCIAQAGERSRRHICGDCARPRQSYIQRLHREALSGGDEAPDSQVIDGLIHVTSRTSRPLPGIGVRLDEAVALIEAADRLQQAIGRASSHFRRSERGGWQHQLLLASKEMNVEMDRLRPKVRRARAEHEKTVHKPEPM